MRELTSSEIACISGGSASSYQSGYEAGYATGRFLTYASVVFGIGAAIAVTMS